MSPTRWRVAALGVVVLLGLGVATWRALPDDEVRHAGEPALLGGAIPVRDGVLRGPGTTLGDGFTVAEGSHLLADVLPTLYSRTSSGLREDDGWLAVLLVEGRGQEVFADYLAQAEAAGFTMRAQDPSASPCEATSCFAFDVQGEHDHGRSVDIELHQETGGDDRPPQSGVVIEYREVGSPPYPGGAAGIPAPPWTASRGTPDQTWPALPEVGLPFFTYRPHEPFVVAEGTLLLAHSARFDLGGGTISLFEVTDDPEAVLRRYFDQPPGPGDQESIDTWERDGARVTFLSWSDGGTYLLRVFEREGEPTWMMLEAWSTD